MGPNSDGKRLVEAHQLAVKAGMTSFWTWLWVDIYIADTFDELKKAGTYIKRLNLEPFDPERTQILRRLFEQRNNALKELAQQENNNG